MRGLFTAGVLDVLMEHGVAFDGGLSDGIPLRYFKSLGYGWNLVITTHPHGYRKFPKKRMCLLKPFLRRHPAIYKALTTRHVWYNETLDYIDSRVTAGAAGEDFVKKTPALSIE